MSYRNKIACILKKEDYNTFINLLKINEDYISWKKDEKTDGVFFQYSYISKIPQYNAVLLKWDWVSWDPLIDLSIMLFMQYLNYLKNKNKPFHYIRIGEGADTNTDIEDLSCLGDPSSEKWKENLMGMCNLINWKVDIVIDF